MKKVMISLFIISLISLIMFTGCFDNSAKSNEKQYFYGTWKGEVNQVNLTYTFYENNTYYYKIGTSEVLGSWELVNNQLNLTIRGNSELFDYSFSDEYTSLTLNPINFNFSYTIKKQ